MGCRKYFRETGVVSVGGRRLTASGDGAAGAEGISLPPAGQEAASGSLALTAPGGTNAWAVARVHRAQQPPKFGR